MRSLLRTSVFIINDSIVVNWIFALVLLNSRVEKLKYQVCGDANEVIGGIEFGTQLVDALLKGDGMVWFEKLIIKSFRENDLFPFGEIRMSFSLQFFGGRGYLEIL